MLKGKCAIVTGASRGIGKSIALKLASLGVNIVVNYRSNEKEALEVENEIKSMNVKALCIKADISSVVGISGNVGQVNYSASKAGAIGMTRLLAKDVGPRGITVNAVGPGYIETDMIEVLGDKFKEEIKKNIPLKRIGTAKDVAEVVAFLASESADYVTDQVIKVDGGISM